MDISNLGAVLYRAFCCSRAFEGVRKLGEDFPGLTSLLRVKLSESEVTSAKKRSLARLSLYYDHVQNLVEDFSEFQGAAGASAVLARKRGDDAKLLKDAYDSLAQRENVQGAPGMALFLQVGDRSYALLPELASSSSNQLVYMSESWREALFCSLEKNRVDPFEEARRSLLDRVERSNRLWQRERWSCLPVRSSAEPGGSNKAIVFNDISRHNEYIDGWVDAFWGVQSGVRLPVPIPGDFTEAAYLVLLFTTYVPDAFKSWVEDDGKTYSFRLSEKDTEVLVDEFRDEFRSELEKLSLVVPFLCDIDNSERSLLEMAMRMLSHHYNPRPTGRKQWEREVFLLIDKLKGVSEYHFKKVASLKRPRAFVLSRLRSVADELEDCGDEAMTQWVKGLDSLEQKDHPSHSFPKSSSIRDLLKSMELLGKQVESHLIVDEQVKRHLGEEIVLDPFLFFAIFENLVNKHNVPVRVDIEDEKLTLTAFYNKWALHQKDERDFFLKPLTPQAHNERRRIGFHLTAELIWRNQGTVEYYRLEDLPGQSVALIHIKTPFRRRSV